MQPLGISHLSFADDVILLCRGDRGTVQTLMQLLKTFGKTSGLDINTSKSSIYFGGVGDSVKQAILSGTGFSESAHLSIQVSRGSFKPTQASSKSVFSPPSQIGNDYSRLGG
jgi:hypothetical protein